MLITIVLFEILISANGIVLACGRLSLWTAALGILYFLGMKMLSDAGHTADLSAEERSPADEGDSLQSVYARALISAVVIIISAMFLSNAANAIAEITGLGGTFVGSIFLAFATSLPEIVVSISALRLNALDMAIGNIFGSNMTNMFIIVLCGLVRDGAPILSVVSETHSITAMMSILLTVIILLSIRMKKNTIFSIGWDSVVMVGIFLFGMRALYVLK